MEQSFFPSAPEGHRYPIEVRDISGKEWKFYFRVWRNGPGRMYVLDGVREYMAAMEWRAGDKGNCVPHCTSKIGNPYDFSLLFL